MQHECWLRQADILSSVVYGTQGGKKGEKSRIFIMWKKTSSFGNLYSNVDFLIITKNREGWQLCQWSQNRKVVSCECKGNTKSWCWHQRKAQNNVQFLRQSCRGGTRRGRQTSWGSCRSHAPPCSEWRGSWTCATQTDKHSLYTAVLLASVKGCYH